MSIPTSVNTKGDAIFNKKNGGYAEFVKSVARKVK
jgi:hypothetical protein